MTAIQTKASPSPTVAAEPAALGGIQLEPVRRRLSPRQPGSLLLQRKCACGGDAGIGGACPDCTRKRLQRKATGEINGAHPAAIVGDVLRGPGMPLDTAARSFFEPRFGHDFGQVRVHTDDKAAESARAVNAQAYTVGGDIVFGAGQYAPGSTSGRHLLGHELTHVVQQAGAAGLNGSASESSQLAAEREAESNANALGSGPGMALQAVAMPRLLQRRVPEGDPIHDPIVEDYRRRHGLPPGGRDERGQSVGPSDAEIKYRLAPEERRAPRRPPRRIQNFQRHAFGLFDAELDSDRGGGSPPCQLTITTRVKFNFPNTSGVWPQGWPALWQQQFADRVQRKWSYRYLLIRSGSCPADEPCERVAVRVRVVPVAAGQHHTVNVLFNKPSGARSNVAGSPAGVGTFHGVDLSTNTALHETGHLFGLEHIRCDDNGWTCYGLTAGQADDVMGGGAFISARDYEPFIEVMRQLTHCDWRTHSTHTRDVPSWMIGAGLIGLMFGIGLTGVLGMGLGWMIGAGLVLGAIGAGLGWAIDMT